VYFHSERAPGWVSGVMDIGPSHGNNSLFWSTYVITSRLVYFNENLENWARVHGLSTHPPGQTWTPTRLSDGVHSLGRLRHNILCACLLPQYI
jgi:hypothetical protein